MKPELRGLALGLLVWSPMVWASDFAPLYTMFIVVTGVIAVIWAGLTWALTRQTQGLAWRSLGWGTWLAFCTVPVTISAGNGTAHSPILMHVVLAPFGSDPDYLTASVQVLPAIWACCTGLVGLFFWLRSKDPGYPPDTMPEQEAAPKVNPRPPEDLWP